MIKELLEFSYQQKLSHIPSALSMLDYVDVLFSDFFITRENKIVIGKPFGSQTYYLIWKKLNYIDDITNLNVGVKHDEISFVEYGEESMGNALGVSIGISIANPSKKIWVNISDATLQMGNTLEALQFIGHHNLSNIFVTVDYNNTQVTGEIKNILHVDPVIYFCKNYNWSVQLVNGHDRRKLKECFSNLLPNKPNIVFCHTKKGHGVKFMEENVREWHYKKIENEQELNYLMSNIE